MTVFRDKLKPSVEKPALIGIAGIVWLATGLMLISLAISWLNDPEIKHIYWYAFAGIGASIIIHLFGFLRIVDKNLSRIRKIEGTYCAFGFMPLKSYFLIAIMMSFGIILRNSILPKEYLSIIYIAIGMALALSSIRYFRNIKNKS